MEQLKKGKAGPRAVHSFADILGIKDLSCRPVYVEAWDKTCYIREMSGSQVGYFASLATLVSDDADAVTIPVDKMAEVITMQLCDEDGNLIGCQPGGTTLDEDGNVLTFEQASAELAGKSSDAITTLFMKCLEVSRLGAAQIEDAQKKFDADR